MSVSRIYRQLRQFGFVFPHTLCLESIDGLFASGLINRVEVFFGGRLSLCKGQWLMFEVPNANLVLE